MCKFEIAFQNAKDKKLSCRWERLFQAFPKLSGTEDLQFQTLPEDEAGYCIFHSQDLSWKREKDCFARFSEIIAYIDQYLQLQDDLLELYHCHIVGKKDRLSEKISGDSASASYLIDYERIVFKKNLRFFNCVFHDEVQMARCVFRRNLGFQECTFQKAVNVFGTSIGGEFSCSDATFFQNLSFWQSTEFYKDIHLIDNTFYEKVDINSCFLHGGGALDNNYFKSAEEPTGLVSTVFEGLAIRNNRAECLFFLDSCVFLGDTMFYRNEFAQFHLENPLLEGSMAFVGTEGQLLFNANSIVEVNLNSFGTQGQLIFDYCNLLNLGSDFLNHLKELEQEQKVTILPTCKIDRLTIIYLYPYTKINQWIIEDLSRLIQKYFDYYFSVHLNIEILRKFKTNQIQLAFRTSEKITEKEFKKRMASFSRIQEKTSTQNIHQEIIKKDFYAILEKVDFILAEDSSQVAEVANLLTFNGDLKLGELDKKYLPANTDWAQVNEEEQVQSFENLIHHNRIKAVCQQLQVYFQQAQQKEALNILVLLMSRYNALLDQKNYELISIFDFEQSLGEIKSKLLELVDEFVA